MRTARKTQIGKGNIDVFLGESREHKTPLHLSYGKFAAFLKSKTNGMMSLACSLCQSNLSRLSALPNSISRMTCHITIMLSETIQQSSRLV